MKAKKLIQMLSAGVTLNPDCEVTMGEGFIPYVSWDDFGNAFIYGVKE